jgi:uncharacterized protein (DUF2062 family)
VLERAGSLNVDEFALARGVAVGVFIGLTPTLGVQTLLILGASLMLRANFPAAFVASFVNNPLTVAPMYYGMNRLGQLLLNVLPGAGGVPLDIDEEIAEEIVEEAAALVVGSLAIAVPVAVLGYYLFLWVWRRFHLHLPRPVPDSDADPATDGEGGRTRL